MITLTLESGTSGPLQILCLGAHSDDIEIGCGGTLLRLAARYPDSKFHWVVFSATGVRREEARRAAELFTLPGQLEDPRLEAFPDGFLPYEGAKIKAVFEQMKGWVAPDLIFTHYRHDAHQDHRLIAELTAQTFRDHFILEYEIPKYDGDLGPPAVFVPLDAKTCQKKVRHIMEVFASQRGKRWFEPETFLSLLRLRGMECNSPSGYAEAFYSRKLVLL